MQLVFEHSLRIRLNQSTPDGGNENNNMAITEGSPSESDPLIQSGSSDDKVDPSQEIGHIVGRINNLITSDLETITVSYFVMLLGTLILPHFLPSVIYKCPSLCNHTDGSFYLVPLRCSGMEVRMASNGGSSG